MSNFESKTPEMLVYEGFPLARLPKTGISCCGFPFPQTSALASTPRGSKHGTSVMMEKSITSILINNNK